MLLRLPSGLKNCLFFQNICDPAQKPGVQPSSEDLFQSSSLSLSFERSFQKQLRKTASNKQCSKKPTKCPVISQAVKHQETNNSCQQTQRHSLSGCGTGDWGVDASHVLCFHRYRGCLWMPSTIEYLPSTRCVPPCTKGLSNIKLWKNLKNRSFHFIMTGSPVTYAFSCFFRSGVDCARIRISWH